MALTIHIAAELGRDGDKARNVATSLTAQWRQCFVSGIAVAKIASAMEPIPASARNPAL